MEVKFCGECINSRKQKSKWMNSCMHPKVVAQNAWALANNCGDKYDERCGVDCVDQRRAGLFKACGIRGKLWEA